jgi:hypothetical protein
MTSVEEIQSTDVLIDRKEEVFYGFLISMTIYVYLPWMMMEEDPFGLLGVLESFLLGLERTFESTYLPAMAGAPLVWNLLACYAIVQVVRTFPWKKTVETLLIAHLRLLVVLPVYVLRIALMFIVQLVYLVWCMITLNELHHNRWFGYNIHPFTHLESPSSLEVEVAGE